MKIALINCSPKSQNSCSGTLLYDLRPLIENNNKILNFNLNKFNAEDFDRLYKCNIIIFSYPLYVDGIPSHMLSFLMKYEEYLKGKEHKNVIVYAIANCGFYEGNQTKLSLQIIENWCSSVKFKFAQGVGVGGGPMIGSLKNAPLGHGPKKSLNTAYTIFAHNILRTNYGENIYINPSFPRFAYILAAHHGWKTSAKINGLKKIDLKRKLK